MINFTAVVGNPPYMITLADNGRKSPIYHLFYDTAARLAPIVTLITPGRFLTNAGQTPDEWNRRMLHDPHFRVVLYTPNSGEIFPNVSIKGGVAIGLIDREQYFGKIGTFVHFTELRTILEKVKRRDGDDFMGLDSLVSSQGIYRFTDAYFEEIPEAISYQGNGTGSKITSRAFATNSTAFLINAPNNEEYIKIIGLVDSNKRVVKWVNRKYIQSNPYLTSYNVLVPEANGSGAIGEVLSTPMIGEPMIGSTDTFLSIGRFDSEAEARACLRYVKTRFARTMLGILKVTQHNPRDTWAYVPLPDFTTTRFDPVRGTIDWKRSVDEIDEQLFQIYGLNDEEIAFIRANIQPMAD